MIIEVPEFNEIILKIIGVKSTIDSKTKTMEDWMLEHRNLVEENIKLVENSNNNKIKILIIFLSDLLMRAMRGERGTLIYISLNNHIKYDSDLNDKNYRRLLKEAQYRWIEQGIEVIHNVVDYFDSEYQWDFKIYFKKAEENYRTNFVDDGLLEIKNIGFKVRDLALSGFNHLYVANDLHVVRVLTRTGLLNYGFEFLNDERFEMGNNPSNSKNYLFLHQLIIKLYEMTDCKYRPADIDRIFWHFGRTICSNKPKCDKCVIKNICLTGKSRGN